MSQLYNHVKVVSPDPVVGMGVTIFYWSDRSAATVSRISKSGKTVWIKADKATRIDSNGLSDMQEYKFEQNPDAEEMQVRLRKDGQWYVVKHGYKVAFGRRSYYIDPHF